MKRFLVRLLIFGVLLGGGVIFLFAAVAIPPLESLEERRVVESTKIYDRTGETLLYDIHAEIRRTRLGPEKIPRHIKNATVAIEDSNFYRHRGISLGSLLRALVVNIFSGEFKQGGSTITQQLVKNALLTQEKTLVRKAKELVLAIKVDARLEKEKILNLYLNEIPYGSSAYGIEAASQTYFGKSAQNLTLAEAVYLAALPKAPTRYSPYGLHREELEARKNLVLERMRELGFISRAELEEARQAEVKFLNRAVEGIRAPHFSLYVKEYLVEKYGEDVVERGGLQVITTLNWDWQKKAEELVKRFGEENEKKFNAANSGLVGLDPKTGEILVMVGSRDYFGKPFPESCTPGINCRFDPQVNVTLTRRQPGSALKPLVYAAAFEKGYTPETVLFDLPTEFNPLCSPEGTPPQAGLEEKCYHPENYDEKFRGPVSLREALAQSINLPSVKVLYLTGLRNALRMAERLGIRTLTEPERYGLTLVLGGGEVKLLELTSAYSALANDGTWNEPIPILKLTDAKGKILEEYQNKPQEAVAPEIARMVTDILSDNEARTPAFGRESFLYFPERPVAVKTGTTNDFRDAWVIGSTPNLAAGVWVGNSDNTAMEKKVAGFIAAPLWQAFLREIFKELAREDFKSPLLLTPDKPVLRGEWRGGRVYSLDKISKKLATSYTPEELVEKKVIQEVHSILYWLDRKEDSQFKNWESAVKIWATKNGLKDETEAVVPKEFDDLHRPEFLPKVTFLEPEGEVFPAGGKIRVVLGIESRFGVEQIDFFLESQLGSQYLGSIRPPPFEFLFTLPLLPRGEAELSLRVYDVVRNRTVATKKIKVAEN